MRGKRESLEGFRQGESVNGGSQSRGRRMVYRSRGGGGGGKSYTSKGTAGEIVTPSHGKGIPRRVWVNRHEERGGGSGHSLF